MTRTEVVQTLKRQFHAYNLSKLFSPEFGALAHVVGELLNNPHDTRSISEIADTIEHDPYLDQWMNTEKKRSIALRCYAEMAQALRALEHHL